MRVSYVPLYLYYILLCICSRRQRDTHLAEKFKNPPARPVCPFLSPFFNNPNPYPPVSVIGYLPSRYRHFRVLTSIPTPNSYSFSFSPAALAGVLTP